MASFVQSFVPVRLAFLPVHRVVAVAEATVLDVLFAVYLVHLAIPLGRVEDRAAVAASMRVMLCSWRALP
jgi:hypothetical protein